MTVTEELLPEQQIESEEQIEKKSKLISFILIFNLSYFFFFRPLNLNDDLLKAFYYVLLAGMIFYSRNYIFGSYRDRFSYVIRTMSLFTFISVFCATLFWKQGFLDTFISTIPNFSFLFYFYLAKSQPKMNEVERFIWVFVAIYLVCFYVGLAVSPFRLFKGYGELDKEIDTSRGISRIRLTLIGAGPLYLAYFLSISKIKYAFNKKWVVVCVVLFVTIVLHLGRQAIIFSFILGLLYFLDNLSLMKRLLVVFGFVAAFWVLLIVSPVISALIEKSETEYSGQKEGDENPRVGAYRFYFTEVSPNVITDLLGNGRYSLGKSKYGDFIDKYGRSQGYVAADVGYASIFLYFGFVGLFLFFKLLISTLRTRVPNEFAYAKYYIFFLFLGNIAGSTLLGTVPVLCVALYVINISRELVYK
ncbi:O-antigen ligase family protein [Pedobacter panaciterrae]|uniref:O-antigen ligase family protein n=1 Tax=Pedobacter panaciterrae TaxID=363849 RepID=A0ABU8NWS1_9SPHI|nr:O-antigen ligase family protein [uncultured Pedobacter sp.]